MSNPPANRLIKGEEEKETWKSVLREELRRQRESDSDVDLWKRTQIARRGGSK